MTNRQNSLLPFLFAKYNFAIEFIDLFFQYRECFATILGQLILFFGPLNHRKRMRYPLSHLAAR